MTMSDSSNNDGWIEPDGTRPNLPDDAVVELKFQNEELGFLDEAGIVISMPVRAVDWEGAKEKGLVYRVAYRKPEA